MMNDSETFKQKRIRLLKQLAPWAAGASLAVTHIAMSTNCTITREGRCNTCGSCAVALVALVSWAIMKKGDKDAQESHFQKRI